MGYICIHGHFYQPPRENPWLEAIELQDSAQPYHDWNERITAECFGPNSASRILDAEGKIVKIMNNFAKISSDFGPTLLSWMEVQAPAVYRAILEADLKSREAFSGHGTVIAQGYNHMILPLANPRDKRTQIVWGMQDFEHRFGRRPEGLWLPETAVDLESLCIMAKLGLRFTILAPHQARRVRKIGGRVWRDVSGGRIDPTMAYRLRLPNRRTISLFFYDAPVSRAVAFEGLLSNGEQFAKRLLNLFSEERAWPELVHIATDGETYGHHHKQGEMGLAYALDHIESTGLAEITNYGEYLERHPPTHEVEIFENSSWSCIHGIERWRSDCGCNSGKGWSQNWRAPLREALDWLRDRLAPIYEQEGAKLLKDPWVARDEYISVILNRRSERIESFFSKHAQGELDVTKKTRALILLEMQRHAMLMYTSCGWFFDELSGIETVQIIQYAARAIQLAQAITGEQIEETFVDKLGKANSNLPEHKDGALIYEKFVKPAVVNLQKLGAHFAITSLFTPYEEQAKIYCYQVAREDFSKLEAGRIKLIMGRARFTSEITRESARITFGVLHLGDHNLNGGVTENLEEPAYQALKREMGEAFSRADIPEVIRILDRGFGKEIYSLRSLFRDEQHRILNQILESKLIEVDAAYEQIYTDHAPLMYYLAGLDIPFPKPFHRAAEFALNNRLRRAFGEADLDLERLRKLLDEVKLLHIPLAADVLEFTLRKSIERTVRQLSGDHKDLALLLNLEAIIEMVHWLPFEVDLSNVQNTCYELAQTTIPSSPLNGGANGPGENEWRVHFHSLADKLGIRIPEIKRASA